MLSRIRLSRLGVIDEAVLDLSPGLTVLTGETGAGKTMVVSGLGLLLGARADASLVRSGADTAVVEGSVLLPESHPALLRAAEAGADVSEDELVLVRTVSASGRSRAHVGGRTAPVGVLGELGEMLVAVHGQAEQWRLRSPEQHRLLLDASAPQTVGPALAAYQECFAAYRQAAEELRSLTQEQDRRTSEADVLRAGLAELERLDPMPGEDLALRAEEERLGHVDALRSSATSAYTYLAGADETSGVEFDTCAAQSLAQARESLSGVSSHDQDLAALETRIADLAYLATDVAGDLSNYLSGLEIDPARLAWVQQRRSELSRLTRAYGETIDEVLAWGARAAARLDELLTADDRIGELRAAEQRLRAELAQTAAALHTARAEAAEHLGRAVTTELSQLAMGKAAVSVVLGHTPDPAGLQVPGFQEPVRYGAAGIDDVEIRLAANPGAPARSVGKAASGGELSRVMLAIEVVIAGAASGSSEVTTFVFDEVDAGIGGRAALAVGARLAELARCAQVIVVTHLPQVAAYADRHLVINKANDGQVTASDISQVSGQDRLRELSRMMAGSDESEAALDHARELLKQAQQR
ncbi:DNA repair protein RecN [Gephyromycinifex aptenodytis]|uniref:DNA repair protein RecN n=1 Tax=Gephyromycinifex aptenodytis TaxID=2716227 RepID=UPI0014480D4E|nr:DNA repair protein RecN [Gephyromycinifex aptenodytis]